MSSVEDLRPHSSTNGSSTWRQAWSKPRPHTLSHDTCTHVWGGKRAIIRVMILLITSPLLHIKGNSSRTIGSANTLGTGACQQRT
ncbi:hypothetical protein BaRGS_00008701 [Batillaria attramentaria]|uniref:Uncharacterized protein n=1 Tax=Batillaria attramentaria TaxID=370345 RepID=A0ABD0LMC1_9CAEN